jgi:PAS domain S-box-containing protein
VNAQSHHLVETAQELYETAPCGYVSTLADGTIVAVNATFLAWTGFSKDDVLVSKRIQDLLGVPARIFYETQFLPLLQMQGRVKEVAFDILRPNAPPLPVLLNAVQRVDSTTGEIVIHCALFDATDRRKYEAELLRSRRELEAEVNRRTSELEAEVAVRKLAEEDLQQTTSKLLHLRDEERRALARELHDSVGQLLSALSMNIALVSAESSKLSPRAAAAVQENSNFVTQISSEIRTISHLLHPPLLEELGLASALRWLVDGLSERANIEIALEVDADLSRLSPQMELTIFRIVQEALTNVHRHSGSLTARVSVELAADAVTVRVEDQGRGVPANLSAGVGLRGMRERVKQFGGSFALNSSPRGTTVTVVLPGPPSHQTPAGS